MTKELCAADVIGNAQPVTKLKRERSVAQIAATEKMKAARKAKQAAAKPAVPAEAAEQPAGPPAKVVKTKVVKTPKPKAKTTAIVPEVYAMQRENSVKPQEAVAAPPPVVKKKVLRRAPRTDPPSWFTKLMDAHRSSPPPLETPSPTPSPAEDPLVQAAAPRTAPKYEPAHPSDLKAKRMFSQIFNR